MIEIYVRDCNGKRERWEFDTESEFIAYYNENTDEMDEDMYEIQMVIYDGLCIYSGLVHEGVTFEELSGFFA